MSSGVISRASDLGATCSGEEFEDVLVLLVGEAFCGRSVISLRKFLRPSQSGADSSLFIIGIGDFKAALACFEFEALAFLRL